ncbi:class I SAM-dependent methyltransferase [Candidatus Woesebacteria bacterium]|nr:class I SAM-dependent methyltransferase [Candidatus Woesebacteria bacterium]
MNKRILNLFYKSKVFKKIYGYIWYELISYIDKKGIMRFMNYGYADSNRLKLAPEDEDDRYNIQLYDVLTKKINLSNKELLEVGCGRGGGIAYFAKYYKPKQIVGVDVTKQAISFCNNKYHIANASFREGDAQELPFPDNSFDVVINLESSGNYDDSQKFFREVSRVLKPGGYFAYADLRKKEEFTKWMSQLKALQMTLVEQVDITNFVSAALEITSNRKEQLITENVPKILQAQFKEFAGTKNSNYVYNALKAKEKIYFRFLFRK